MLKDIPITEARHELTSLPERLAKEPGAGPSHGEESRFWPSCPGSCTNRLRRLWKSWGTKTSWLLCAKASRKQQRGRSFPGSGSRKILVCEVASRVDPLCAGHVGRDSGSSRPGKIRGRIDGLAEEPEKQGKPLTGELAGYRSLRAAGSGTGSFTGSKKARSLSL